MNQTPHREAVSNEIKRFILAQYMPGKAAEPLLADDLLFEGGIIDSGGALEFVMFLERQYQIKVLDDELFLENFATISHVASFVLKKLEQVSSPEEASPKRSSP